MLVHGIRLNINYSKTNISPIKHTNIHPKLL